MDGLLLGTRKKVHPSADYRLNGYIFMNDQVFTGSDDIPAAIVKISSIVINRPIKMLKILT